MGKMKELFTELQEKGVMSELRVNESKEEAHYWFTVLAVVELMAENGQSKVINDIKDCLLSSNIEGDMT